MSTCYREHTIFLETRQVSRSQWSLKFHACKIWVNHSRKTEIASLFLKDFRFLKAFHNFPCNTHSLQRLWILLLQDVTHRLMDNITKRQEEVNRHRRGPCATCHQSSLFHQPLTVSQLWSAPKKHP